MFYVLNNTNRGCGVAVTHESGMLAWVGVGVGVVKIGQLVDFEFLSLWVITVISFFLFVEVFSIDLEQFWCADSENDTHFSLWPIFPVSFIQN